MAKASNSDSKVGLSKKDQKASSAFSNIVFKNEKEIADLTKEINYNEQKIFDIQKLRGDEKLTQVELDIINDINKKLEEQKKKLKELQTTNEKIILSESSLDSLDEYDSALRSIGSRYGEINSVYAEGEKILDYTKGQIAGIVSLTGLLKTQNSNIIPLVLATQKGFRGITSSIVESIGSLEDSEAAYKRVGIKIDEQKDKVSSLGSKLDEIYKTDPENTLVIDLKKQIEDQTNSLDKMKIAAQNVSAKLKSITKAASVLGQTPVGSFINDMLAGVQQLGRAFGAELPGSIDDLLEGSKKSIAKGGLEKIKKQQTESEIPQPNLETIDKLIESKEPQPSPIQNVTQDLEEKQTKAAEKSTNFLSRLASAGNKSRAKRAKLEAKGVKEKEQASIPPPDQTSIDNSRETTSITNVTNNVGEEATPTAESGTKPIDAGLGSVSEVISQEMKSEGQDFTEKAKESGTSATNSLLEGGTKIAEGATAAGAAAGGGGALAMLGPIAAITAGVFMLGSAIKDSIKYFDSLEDATDTLARKMYGASQIGMSEEIARESIGDLGTPIGQLGSEQMQDEVRNTKEFRQLTFDFSIGQAVKQRQALADDYFNFEKQSYLDLVGYQQSLVTDEIDYQIGLERDALNFQFQQQSANLDAELSKRKTLAGSAMKFIGQYASVSERALNAIGSSTKAIMDGMKQFGAILGGTNQSQFKLIENAQGLAYAYGSSADQVLNMSHMFKMLGNTTEKAGMQLVEGMKEFVGQDGNVQAVFSEIAEASADIYRLMSATPEQIVKQTKALAKAGVKLSSMLKASDTMVLNYKDSIKAEMSLGAMIGQNVNFTEARAALMSGDMVGAANAIRDSLSGIDVNELNPFAKQDLARATGLTMDQIIQIQQGGEIETEEDKQLKMAELTGKTIAKAALNQDIANAGAKLALEQAQRKQMLEFEQRVRLLMLNVEQAKRLQMIPIEAAYRAKYAQDIQFPAETENMMLGVLREGLTGTFSGLEASNFQAMGNEMMAAYGLTANVPGLSPTGVIGMGVPSVGGGVAGVPSVGGGVAGVPSVGGGVANIGNTIPLGISQLQNTMMQLNKTLPSLVSMADPRYAQYMITQFKMGEEYQRKVSKKGMSDDEKSKIALEYEQKTKNLYQQTFAPELNRIEQVNQENQQRAIKTKEMKSTFNVDTLIEEFESFNTNEQKVVDILKTVKTKEEFDQILVDYKKKTGKDLTEGISSSFSTDEYETAELSKQLNKLGYELRGTDITGQNLYKKDDTKSGIVKTDVKATKDDIEKYKTSGNDIKNIKAISSEFDAFNTDEQKIVDVLKNYKTPQEFQNFLAEFKATTGKDFNKQFGSAFQQGNDKKEIDQLNEHLKKLGYVVELNSKSGTTGIKSLTGETTSSVGGGNTYTAPGTNLTPGGTTPPSGGQAGGTPPPGGQTIGNISSPELTVNMADTNAILNKIQSEAHSRGITMYTKEIQQNGNLERIVTRTQNTAAAVETSKIQIIKLVDEGLPSTKNLEKLQIETIAELRVATDLLALVVNNTGQAPPTVISLDGQKIGNNFKNREGRRGALGLSNGASISP